MIVLHDEHVLVRVDPRHGGELLDLVDLRTGRQLLGRAPFASQEPATGALDEPTWTAGYRGGWQVLLPNAGNECVVDGTRHGFHGAGSHEPWTVVAAGPDEARLRWTGHGLAAERRLAVEDGAVVAETEVRALDGPAPLTPVEHLSVGLELLDPEVVIELPGGRAHELHEEEGPARPPAAAPAWPEVALLDGGTERADRWPLREPRSRYLVVADLPEGVATVRNAGTGQGLDAARQLTHLGLVRHESQQLLDGVGSHTASEFRRNSQSPFAAAMPRLLPRANPSFLAFRTTRSRLPNRAFGVVHDPSVDALSTRTTSSAGQLWAKSDASASWSIAPPFQLTTMALTSGDA